MNQIASNKVLAGSNNSFKGTSFIVFLIVLFTILIAFNTCEKPVRVIQMNTIDAKAEDISFTSAILKGEITDLGSTPIEDHGILVSPNSTPNIGNSKVVSLGKCSARGGFQVNAEDLDINTTYFYRSFINADDEYIYSDPIREFRTKECHLGTITTTAVSFITDSSASSGGNIIADGGAPVTARGVCWSTAGNPTIYSEKTIDGSGTGSFSSNITGLNQSTVYNVRAYAENAAGAAYGEIRQFSTISLPTVVTTIYVPSITSTTVTLGGEITNDGGSVVTERGACWNTSNNPTTAHPHAASGTGTGSFTIEITGLISGTTYHVRAYAKSSIGTAYGDDISFTTKGIPAVVTSDVSLITGTTASSGGYVTEDGGAEVTEKGVCWGTTINPTIDNPRTSNGTGPGLYTSEITGLNPGTRYHVRAYATNIIGTAYGNDIMFITKSKPTVITSDISGITESGAFSGGNVISDGGAPPVTERGVCWSILANPTTDDQHTTDDSGSGPFISNITGLTTGTTYHVRAYATNYVGTEYGNDIMFTTLRIPILSTLDISFITPTTAKSGGNITFDGGTAVTARGVCWNTAGNPTISDFKTTDGQGSGIFVSDLENLTQSTYYFVRSYAINSVGIAYGNEVSFKSDFLCGTRFLDRRDNKSYWTTKIGNQCWFSENLNAGTLINGSGDQTNNAILEKYCYDNLESNCNVYGGLYQWDEMMQYTMLESTKGVCPDGWHVPSDNEWKTLEMTLGMSQATADLAGWRGTTEGGKLKATGTAYWESPNLGATNSSLFTALPAGDRTSDAIFEGKGTFTDFWTSTFLFDTRALYRLLNSTYSQIYRVDGIKQFATSVRCVKD